MAKNKLVKNITTDELAVIINKGFDGQMAYMEKKFAQVASKKDLEEVQKDVKYIKENLEDAAKLERDVEYIKNTLSIPAMKKS